VTRVNRPRRWPQLATARAAFVIAALSLAHATAAAQELAVRIIGHVSDSFGGALPGATVTVTAGEFRRVTTATADGKYEVRFEQHVDGPFIALFELVGFTSVTKEGLDPSVDGVVTVNAQLKVDLNGCSYVDYVRQSAPEAIEHADAVVRIRLPSSIEIIRSCGFKRAVEDSAQVLDMVKMKVLSWRSSRAMPVSLEFVEDPQGGDEFLAFLHWDSDTGRFQGSTVSVLRIVDGRLGEDLDNQYGLGTGVAVREAINRLRTLCRFSNVPTDACR
jgi:hypothetical protein